MSFITQKIYLLFIFPFIFFGILIDISSFVLNKIKFIISVPLKWDELNN